jgi:hypothetical protein
MMKPVLLATEFAIASFVKELRARDNGFDQTGKPVARGEGALPHGINGGIVGQLKTPAEGVGKELAGEILKKISSALASQVFPQANYAGPLAASREDGMGIHRMACQIDRATFTDGAVAFKCETERVKTRMAASAELVLPVLC